MCMNINFVNFAPFRQSALLPETLHPRGLRFPVPLDKGNEGSGNEIASRSKIQHFVQLRMLSGQLRSRSAIFRAPRLQSLCLGGNYRESSTNRAIFRISIFASEWAENVENGPKSALIRRKREKNCLDKF